MNLEGLIKQHEQNVHNNTVLTDAELNGYRLHVSGAWEASQELIAERRVV